MIRWEALLNLCHSPQGGQVNSTILPTTDSDIEDLLDFCHGPEGEREPFILPPQEPVNQLQGQGEIESSIYPPQDPVDQVQGQVGQGETEPLIPPPEAPIDFDFDLSDLIQLTIGELSKDQSDLDKNSLSDKPVDLVMHNRNQTVLSQIRKQAQINVKKGANLQEDVYAVCKLKKSISRK